MGTIGWLKVLMDCGSLIVQRLESQFHDATSEETFSMSRHASNHIILVHGTATKSGEIYTGPVIVPPDNVDLTFSSVSCDLFVLYLVPHRTGPPSAGFAAAPVSQTPSEISTVVDESKAGGLRGPAAGKKRGRAMSIAPTAAAVMPSPLRFVDEESTDDLEKSIMSADAARKKKENEEAAAAAAAETTTDETSGASDLHFSPQLFPAAVPAPGSVTSAVTPVKSPESARTESAKPESVDEEQPVLPVPVPMPVGSAKPDTARPEGSVKSAQSPASARRDESSMRSAASAKSADTPGPVEAAAAGGDEMSQVSAGAFTTPTTTGRPPPRSTTESPVATPASREPTPPPTLDTLPRKSLSEILVRPHPWTEAWKYVLPTIQPRLTLGTPGPLQAKTSTAPAPAAKTTARQTAAAPGTIGPASGGPVDKATTTTAGGGVGQKDAAAAAKTSAAGKSSGASGKVSLASGSPIGQGTATAAGKSAGGVGEKDAAAAKTSAAGKSSAGASGQEDEARTTTPSAAERQVADRTSAKRDAAEK